jgi:polyisoprenoid-binding protein YceI
MTAPRRHGFRPARAASLSLAALLVASAAAAGTAAAAERYLIDPEHRHVAFQVGHMNFYKVLGLFREVEGSFAYDEATRELSDLRVVVRTASVFTDHQRRDDHLRSPDFLNAAEFPEMVFEATSATPLGDDRGTIEGELTLLGTTRPLTLDVTLNKAGVDQITGAYTLGISATGSLKRSDFGMTYALQDDLVGDQVDLMLGFQAIRQD